MTQISLFGLTQSTAQVDKITLTAGALTAAILTRGAVLQSVRLDGVAHDLTLGSDSLADYEGPLQYFGAIVGPVANRLNGASAPIAGKLHHFAANPGGPHLLHSGAEGTHARLWQLSQSSDSSATLSLTLADGDGGLPGTRHLLARFTVLPPATLRLELTMTTDQPTLANLANHSYWNLDGTAEWTGHRLHVAAEHYLPTTPDLIPTGQIAPVADTPFDFRSPRAFAPGAPPLDTNFCLSAAPAPLRKVASLHGASGLVLTLATTEPGLQVYDGRAAVRPGHAPYEGLALEAQGWPDAPNQPGFPPIDLAPGQTYRQITEWRFTKA